jgi:3-oxoacyl-[acyl-carrier protein] reductase
MSKVVIISGGSSGIGYETAGLFVKRSHNVIISGRNRQKLSDAHKRLKEQYPEGNILSYPADMSNLVEANELFQYATTNYGRINIFINCCGVWSSKSLLEISSKDIDDSFNNNLKSVIAPTVIAAQFMKSIDHNEHNHIVNIGSFAGYMPRNNASLYSCFKSGIINFTRSSANELIQYGIKVNCVVPGVIDTDMTHDSIEQHEQELTQSISMKRVGYPSEISSVIYWLTTPDSSYINGASIHIDGGKYLTQSL